MDPTLIIAIAGVVLSGTAIGWNMYRDLTDRGQLRVSCQVGSIVAAGEPLDDKTYLFWHVTNVGRRPVVVESIGGAKRRHWLRRDTDDRRHCSLVTRNAMPIILDPGVSLNEYTDDLEFLCDDLEFLTARDSMGRTYRTRRGRVKELIRDREKLSAEERQTG